MSTKTGPRNGIQYAAPLGESPWNTWMDLNLRFLERAGVQLSVISRALTAPPGSPANGATYIVGASATGAWSTHDKAIAYYSTESDEGAGWKFYAPRAGWCAYDEATGVYVVYNGSAWGAIAAPLDTDGTLAANSDTKLATQKAVKTYVDALIAASDAVVYKGVIDCSANPNYPAADAGHIYIVSVAGKIGGASGATVEAGDMMICKVDGTAAGNQATVGANWDLIQTNIAFSPEDSANKDTDGALTANSDTKYPSQKAAKTYIDGKVIDSIADSDTTHAPSRNAVFDALAPKANLAGPTFTGDHKVSEADFLTGWISPAQITANQNDYAPTGFSTASVLRLDANAGRAITGLAGGAAGRQVTIFNVGSFDILFTNEDASSTAANRFAVRRGYILPPNKGATFIYDGISSRWRLSADPDRSVTVVLAADVTNNNAVADTLQDVTGLSFPVLSGKTYKFKFVVAYTSAAVATGARFTVSGPSATNISYMTDMVSTTMSGAHVVNGSASAYDVATVSSAVPNSGAPGPFLAVVWGVVTPSADGTLIARFASEVASSAIVAKAGLSYAEYECLS